MKDEVFEKFMGPKDYSPCLRYVDGTLVDPVAYRRWFIENNVKQLNN